MSANFIILLIPHEINREMFPSMYPLKTSGTFFDPGLEKSLSREEAENYASINKYSYFPGFTMHSISLDSYIIMKIMEE